MRNALIVIVLFAFFFYSGWTVGRNGVKCPPCIEQVAASCPAEDIWVNTAVGLMHFEKGEIDARPPYIKNKAEMDEMFQRIEAEILKQSGKAL